MPGLLSKERIIAGPGFNRWLVPPCALATHLCIGQAYAISVFNLPFTRQLGVTKSIAGDWKLTEVGWIFTIAIFCLGASAAVFGKWVQAEGPRKSGTVAALCWGLGFLVGALGIHIHNLWLVFLGYGVLGGCGLGIGYITPVSTLISWFPDRRGMSTGMAIMGFGGGALIASPLSDRGIPKNQAYNVTMYIMAALLVVAFFANLAVKPVSAQYHERTDAVDDPHGPRVTA